MFFGAVDADGECTVVTVAGSSAALPGTDAGYLKVSAFSEFPAKGRGTGGVRCHRFLRGVDTLILAWVGPQPAIAAAATGVAVELPSASDKRDGSGSAPPQLDRGRFNPSSAMSSCRRDGLVALLVGASPEHPQMPLFAILASGPAVAQILSQHSSHGLQQMTGSGPRTTLATTRHGLRDVTAS